MDKHKGIRVNNEAIMGQLPIPMPRLERMTKGIKFTHKGNYIILRSIVD